MTLRTSLIATIVGLSLAACDSQHSNDNLEDVVSTFREPVAASGKAPKPEEKHVHREYGVFATDDAPVNEPELADKYFAGMRLADCPYHSYSPDTRIRGENFRIGQLPDRILETGSTPDLVQMLYSAAGKNGFGSERDLRVAIVFTGEEFVSKSREALKYLPTGTATLNGQEFQIYTTKIGLFYQTVLKSGEQLGILICGHETF